MRTSRRRAYLKEFANYYARISSKKQKHINKEENAYGREYPWIANPEQVSEWEKVLYTALYDAGIKTIPQLKVEKYKLDLAVLLENGKKLDIEVDGEMYHRSWNGELCYRDQLRNQRLFELGWDVKRFWVYQIRDEMMMCISEINRWIENNMQIK